MLQQLPVCGAKKDLNSRILMRAELHIVFPQESIVPLFQTGKIILLIILRTAERGSKNPDPKARILNQTNCEITCNILSNLA